jgi:hypothetical protein
VRCILEVDDRDVSGDPRRKRRHGRGEAGHDELGGSVGFVDCVLSWSGGATRGGARRQ